MKIARVVFQIVALLLVLTGFVALAIDGIRLSGACLLVFGAAAFPTAASAPGCTDAPDPAQWAPRLRRRFVALRAAALVIGALAAMVAYDAYGAIPVVLLCLMLFVFAGGVVRRREP